MNKFFKSCSIYQKPQWLYLFAHLHTDYGELGRPPVTKLSLNITASELGKAVLQNLDSVSGLVSDINLVEAMAAFRSHLKELGFKNTAAFEKNATVVSVEFDGKFYNVVSNHKDENNVNLPVGSKMLIAAATVEELGGSILTAFQK